MKKLLLKIAFGLVANLIIEQAKAKNKYWADELETLIVEVRLHEGF